MYDYRLTGSERWRREPAIKMGYENRDRSSENGKDGNGRRSQLYCSQALQTTSKPCDGRVEHQCMAVLQRPCIQTHVVLARSVGAAVQGKGALDGFDRRVRRIAEHHLRAGRLCAEGVHDICERHS